MSVISRLRWRDLVWVAILLSLFGGAWVAREARAGAAMATPPGEGIDVVYITVATNFPDSLGVGPGAGVNGAPIIIVPTNPPIPLGTQDELARLDPKKVIIVGGPAAVSNAVAADLATLLPNATIERIAGADRYDTNVLFSESVFPVEGWVSLHASAFTAANPEDPIITSDSVWNPTGGQLWAPVSLPHGAEILELKIIGRDTDAGLGGYAAGDDILAQLVRQSGAAAPETIANAESSGSPAEFEDSGDPLNAVVAKVDNGSWTYFVSVNGADGDPLIRNVMIRYRIGTP
ncbi:MAG TPA: cell wall-binding repeat-containing protein [Acidimicrobiia bacterium]|nr:cell wall-binding repeat-containing protein [Acidimicrobiia bacterium]